jgi:hypothetical protein
MMQNINNNYLHIDLSVMKDRITNDERYENIEPDVIEDYCNSIIHYVMTVDEENVINVYDIADYLINENDMGTFSEYLFSYAMLQLLKEYSNFLRIAYFKDRGWIILKIKGLCIHCLDGDCMY